jgi:Zn-dependent peptidase ImmA (M78 family)
MPKVNHEILSWARVTAGLTREEAVKKLAIRDAKGVGAVNRLCALENGEVAPTRPMLVKMAKHYRRPLLTFYLSAPPVRGDRGADFRALPAERSAAAEAVVDVLTREMRASQSMVRALLQDEEDYRPLRFIGSLSASDGHQAVLDELRELLDVPLDSYYRAQPRPSAAFDLLRAAAESKGVYVLLKGDLGSYHTAIDTDVFRGFSIADEIAPFIVVNDRDARAAWSFTLLHELVHLLLGQTGIGSFMADNELERFCDDVASDFLLPETELQKLDLTRTFESDSDLAQAIATFAGQHSLSRAMVAYRGYRAGMIDQGTFGRLQRMFQSQWLRERDTRRARADDQEGGPNYYVVRRHRLGPALVGLARRMTASGALTTSKAAQVLGVKSTQVQSLLGSGGPS